MDPLISAIYAYMRFVHDGGEDRPREAEQILRQLDAEVGAQCQLRGMVAPRDTVMNKTQLSPFGYCKVPFMRHSGGFTIVLTQDWLGAMQTLRREAELRAGGMVAGGGAGPADGGVGTCERIGAPGSAGAKAKRQRGRRPGSPTANADTRLYRDWRAAHDATGITKAEFLRERGLPAKDMAALERGRANVRRKRRSGRKNLDESGQDDPN
jgi:hypothetical protein